MDEQTNTASTKLYRLYCRNFDAWEHEATPFRIKAGYSGTGFEPKKLDQQEFTEWATRVWRSPVLHSSWLKSFLKDSQSVLDELPPEIAERLR